MTGFTDRTAQGILNHVTGVSAIYTLPTTYLALFTAVGIDAGTGFTEVTGGSYARVALSGLIGASTGSAPSQSANSSAITFTTATASWGTIIGWGLCDAPTSGNLNFWDYLGNFNWLPTTVSSASPAVLTAPAHGYSAADTVVFSTEYDGTAPSFSASNFTGLLAVVSPATDTFTVTNGGTAVNTSSTGSGMIRKVGSQTIGTGIQASFAAGALILLSA
jgi:hypothetical protein